MSSAMDDSDLNITPSKAQRKREMSSFRDKSEKLSRLHIDKIRMLDDEKLIQALTELKKINKGNARKRQIQHITKLISQSSDTTLHQIEELTSHSAHLIKNHRLEKWREELLTNTTQAMNTLTEVHPDLDRQGLRQLVLLATKERDAGTGDTQCYRKLYQFLKEL